MKLVTFTRDMLPIRRGETRVLPDGEASRLAAEGLVGADAPDFPPRETASTAQAPAQDQRRRSRQQSFLTK
jgi:hypothetical protein